MWDLVVVVQEGNISQCIVFWSDQNTKEKSLEVKLKICRMWQFFIWWIIRITEIIIEYLNSCYLQAYLNASDQQRVKLCHLKRENIYNYTFYVSDFNFIVIIFVEISFMLYLVKKKKKDKFCWYWLIYNSSINGKTSKGVNTL